MNKLFRHLVNAICTWSVRHPYILLLIVSAATIPAIHQVRKIKFSTSLLRLLPKTSRAAENTTKLSRYISSDGGNFILLISQTQTNILPNHQKLRKCVEDSVVRIKKMTNVQMVMYRNPSEFVEKYRLMLLPERSLKLLYEKIIGWKSEASPVGVNLLQDDKSEKKKDPRRGESWQEMESFYKKYANHYKYHRSNDGYNYSIKIYTKEGALSFEKLMALYKSLKKETLRIKRDYGFFAGIEGSHRNKIAEYGVIQKNLSSTGLISFILIVIIILLSFRSLTAFILIILPLVVGLIWGFAFVPATVGGLNIITAFLMAILFGMGIDYSIHLIKRFRLELCSRDIRDALTITYMETGKSVAVSALTTALALGLLAFSGFRGFSDFGLIAAISIVTILLAMFLLLPAILVISARMRLLRPRDIKLKKNIVPGRKTVLILSALLLAGLLLTVFALKFDTSFKNMQFDDRNVSGLVKEKKIRSTIYKGSSSPAAIFIADNLPALDRFSQMINSNMNYLKPGSAIHRITSIRDFSPVPGSADWKSRTAYIRKILEEFRRGSWWKHIKQHDRRRWADEIRNWSMPQSEPAAIKQFPESILKHLKTWNNTDKYIIGVHILRNRKHGTNAMAFTRELYSLKMPHGIRGPLGETPVFAEILWLVSKEVYFISLATLGGIFLLIWINLQKIRETVLVMIPLISGLLLTFGILALLGIPLNLFSVLVIPVLLGAGVDDGVHYFHYWKNRGRNTEATQKELFIPLTATTFTTMVGYSGMMFAAHPGIRSIGFLACLGLLIIWFQSLFFFPALLKMLARGFTATTLKD